MIKSRLNIGIIGIGNIGLEVFKQLISNSQLNELFSVESVLVRDIKKYTNTISKDIGFKNKVDIALEKLTDSEDKFSEVLIHAFDWDDWKSKQDPTDLIIPKTKKIRTKIEWMLGQHPTLVEDEGKYHIIEKDKLPVSNWSRDRWNPGGISRVSFSFGAKMHGNIFFDSQLDKYQATVIWLHPLIMTRRTRRSSSPGSLEVRLPTSWRHHELVASSGLGCLRSY